MSEVMARLRARRDDDGGFAIVFVLVFMLLLATLGSVMLMQLTTEVRQTAFSRKHSQSVNTAYAGLNAALSQLRNATDAAGAGVVTKLPCSAGANRTTVTGSLDGSGTNSWSTDIYYLLTDPAGMTQAQVASTAMTCPLVSVPRFAYLSASGRGATLPNAAATLGNRALFATYSFSTTNNTVLGGQISWGTTCWDAGAAPAVGTRLTFQTCGVDGTLSQQWYYRADNSVQWYGDPGANLCLDWSGSAATPPSQFLTLQTCIGTGLAGTAFNPATLTYPRAGQMYQELATHYSWMNVTASGGQGSSCVTSFNATTGLYGLAGAGDAMVMGTSCPKAGSASNAAGTPGTGAGAAAGISTGLPGPTQQLVNLENFSRCLDISENNPANGLITFPCHQPPDATKIDPNQQFGYAGTTSTAGTLSSTWAGRYGTVCLDSDGLALITLVPCVSGKTSQQWRMTGVTPGSYPDSYTVRDYRGLCLNALPPVGTGGGITVALCDGTAAQKWNGVPSATQSQLQGVGER